MATTANGAVKVVIDGTAMARKKKKAAITGEERGREVDVRWRGREVAWAP